VWSLQKDLNSTDVILLIFHIKEPNDFCEQVQKYKLSLENNIQIMMINVIL